jgi:DNA repair protein RAD50
MVKFWQFSEMTDGGLIMERMTVSGARRFHPASPGNTIEFGPSVTLIFGKDGTGKSTIAESLAWVLGGEMTADFVTNPCVLASKTVDAAVELDLTSERGEKMRIRREATTKLSTDRGKRTRVNVKEPKISTFVDGLLTVSNMKVNDIARDSVGTSKALIENVLIGTGT